MWWKSGPSPQGAVAQVKNRGAQARLADRRPLPYYTFGLVRSHTAHDLGGERRDVDGGSKLSGRTARIAARSIVDESPWTLTIAHRGGLARSGRPAPRKIRSEPENWSARVITASPPWSLTAAKMVASSVTTATGPMSASRAIHLNDHPAPPDVGERFARRSVSRQAGGIRTRRGTGGRHRREVSRSRRRGGDEKQCVPHDMDRLAGKHVVSARHLNLRQIAQL